MSFEDLTGRHVLTYIGDVSEVSAPVGFGGAAASLGEDGRIDVSGALGNFHIPAGDDFNARACVKTDRRGSVVFNLPTTAGYHFQIRVDYSGGVAINGTSLVSAQPLIDGAWHFVEFDKRANVRRLWLDGNFVGEELDEDPEDAGLAPPYVSIGASVYPWGGGGFIAGQVSHVSFTKKSRRSTSSSYVPEFPVSGTTDPLWPFVELFMGVGEVVHVPPGESGGGDTGGGGAAVVVVDPIQMAVGLEQVDNGVFDLVYYDPEVFDRAVETLVYAVLFTDAEAPVARVPDRYARQGWWLDADAGSGLWHVRRQPLGSAARREALEMVRAALAAHAPALSGVSVVESAQAAGLVSSVVMEITGFYSGRQFVVSVPL